MTHALLEQILFVLVHVYNSPCQSYYVRIYKHVCTYVVCGMFIQVCMHVSMHMYVHMSMHAFMCMHTCVHAYVHVYICKYMFIF